MSNFAVKKNSNVEFVNTSEIDLKEKSFKYFAEKMYELAGVNLPLNAKNLALVKNRLAKIIRTRGLKSYEDLIAVLEKNRQDDINEFISALTTNKTNFFREEAHFEFFNKFLSDFFESHSELRVWCAASSTGQEPYTISLCMNEALGLNIKKVKMLATDIDLQVLEKAGKGVYNHAEMEGVPHSMRQKYFDIMKSDDTYYRAKPELKNPIRFSQFNLVTGKFDFKVPFNIIFCRNVLIYFDEQTTRQVIDHLTDSVQVGGYLILGHSEAGTVRNPRLKTMGRAIYQRIK